MSTLAMKREFGFNFIGHVSSNIGVGFAARHFMRLLLDQGYEVAALDINPGFDLQGRDRTFAELLVGSVHELPHAVNLVMLQLKDLPALFLNPPDELDGLFRQNRLNAIFPWWELTVLAQRWIEALRLFDVILAPSDFIQHALSFTVPGARILRAQHPLYLPSDDIAGNRARFALPQEPVLFLSSFDPESCLDRKNPLAALTAFHQAFPQRQDQRAGLVIKLNNAAHASGGGSSALSEFQRLCVEDPRVIVIDELLSYEDVLQLYASCDVYVSLHRSEGLGLGPLEAMRLGKPAIATAWSGNLTYMDYRSACLVSYRFTEAGGHPYYLRPFLGKSGFWADPDVDEAARWMTALVDDPGMRAAFGLRARAAAEAQHRNAQEGHFIQELLAIQDQRTILESGAVPRYARLEALRAAEYAYRRSLLTPWQRSSIHAKRVLDRHILWRFK